MQPWRLPLVYSKASSPERRAAGLFLQKSRRKMRFFRHNRARLNCSKVGLSRLPAPSLAEQHIGTIRFQQMDRTGDALPQQTGRQAVLEPKSPGQNAAADMRTAYLPP